MKNNPMLESVDFKQRIKTLTNRELIEETASVVYDMCKDVEELKNRDRRTSGVIGGVGVGIGSAVVVVVEYIFSRLNIRA